MNVYNAVTKRRSIRCFKSKNIPTNVIEKLKKSIIVAPSAGNLQSRKFFFIYDSKIKKALAEASYGQDFISQPHVVVGCADTEKSAAEYGVRGEKIYSIVECQSKHSKPYAGCLRRRARIMLGWWI